MIALRPGATDLDTLKQVYFDGGPVDLDPCARREVEAAAAVVREAARSETAVYGVNTGFGKLATRKIATADTETLQRNLILSHCCGVGDPISPAATRLMMTLKLLSLGRGASGVRWAVIQQIQNMLEHGIIPVVPSQGSVGASGDLAPLAHMTAVMIGEGEATFGGAIVPGSLALQSAGLEALVLGPKEGLALINGTQFSTAHALFALFQLHRLIEASATISCMSKDAVMGSTAPLEPEVHRLRGHRGQIDVAATMRALMDGSEIRESHLEGDSRVQDPYCIRCQPQVLGAALDAVRWAARILETEANAVTDNPLVITSDSKIVSGGNFHAEPVGFAADQMAIAIAEIGAISQRRIALMVDPVLNHNLPPFLTRDPGLNSGFMIAEVTSAALMSENKHLANPCVIDSTPTSANQEDHVSMAAHGALRLGRMTHNLSRILAIELLCAAEGLDIRQPLKTSTPLRRVHERIRNEVPSVTHDRPLSGAIETTATLISDGALSKLSGAKVTL